MMKNQDIVSAEIPAINSPRIIMMVDDDPNMCYVIERILVNAGYRVITVLDGNKALELLAIERPDLILLDIMMPGKSGREVCARIREICSTPIIYFTCLADLLEKNKSEVLKEADALLAKPSSGKDIVSTIEAVISHHV